MLWFWLGFACGKIEDTGGDPPATSPVDADADGWALPDDCADDDAAIHPGAVEVCDDADNDCDGTTDVDAVDAVTTFADVDGDTYGDPDTTSVSCPGPGRVGVAGDCEDDDPAVHPDAAETCDEVDQDCDGAVDEGTTRVWYVDGDGDGYGDPESAFEACDHAPGRAALGEDCDDGDAGRYPGAPEVVDDGVDQDCDGDDATCIGADVGSGASWVDDTTGAPDLSSSSCGGGPERHYRWTAPANGLWSFSVREADFDATLSLGAPGCDAGEIVCDDGADGAVIAQAWLRKGQEIRVTVEGAGGSVGAFTVDAWSWTPEVGSLSAGGGLSCALDAAGEADCYGLTFATPPPGPWVTVEAGPAGACVMDASDVIDCFGTNSYGESTPPAGAFVMATSGHGISYCGLTTAGEIVCWGEAVNGSLSVPSTVEQQLISLGYYGGATLDLHGVPDVWGLPLFGMLPPPAGRFLQVAAGRSFVCGLLDDLTLSCWGTAAWGVTSPPAGQWSMVAAGDQHACAIDLAGTVACWGMNLSGECDAPAGTYVDVQAGFGHTCARRATGEVDCWGTNGYGQCDVP
jgi:hypothetical protein